MSGAAKAGHALAIGEDLSAPENIDFQDVVIFDQSAGELAKFPLIVMVNLDPIYDRFRDDLLLRGWKISELGFEKVPTPDQRSDRRELVGRGKANGEQTDQGQ